jgi:hypothetical protein
MKEKIIKTRFDTFCDEGGGLGGCGKKIKAGTIVKVKYHNYGSGTYPYHFCNKCEPIKKYIRR